MRVALLGDIHGNWTALQEVARDLVAQRAELVIGLGDYLSTSRGAAAVVKWMQAQSASYFVRGDNDSWETYERFKHQERDDSYPLYRYVTSLPKHVVVTLGGLKLLVQHGYPWPPGAGVAAERVQRLLSRAYVESQVNLNGIDVACFGDLHQPDVGLYDDLLLLHPGSVGAPADGEPWTAKYLLLELAQDEISLELRRVPFSVAAAIQEARDAFKVDPGADVWLARWLGRRDARSRSADSEVAFTKERWLWRRPPCRIP